MNDYVKIAKDSITKFINENKTIKTPDNISKELIENRAGVFVSIHLKNPKPGEETLRGCIGTFLPTKNSIAEEIISNAIAAATEDYRFPQITKNELENLEISVDVLGKPESITTSDKQSAINKLNPKKYGVIVKTEGRTGLLLPDIEGVDTPDEQISIARQKAGIGPDEPIKLFRFEVIRYKE